MKCVQEITPPPSRQLIVDDLWLAGIVCLRTIPLPACLIPGFPSRRHLLVHRTRQEPVVLRPQRSLITAVGLAERAVILRLGRFNRLVGPGVFWVIPFIDRIVLWADLRVRNSTFAAERTLTADTVPVCGAVLEDRQRRASGASR